MRREWNELLTYARYSYALSIYISTKKIDTQLRPTQPYAMS